MKRLTIIAILFCLFSTMTIDAWKTKVADIDYPLKRFYLSEEKEKAIIDIANKVAHRLAPDMDYDNLTPLIFKYDRTQINALISDEYRKFLEEKDMLKYKNEEDIVRVYYMSDTTAYDFMQAGIEPLRENKEEYIFIKTKSPKSALVVFVNSKTLQPFSITPNDRIGISFISISYDDFIKKNPDLKFNKDGSLNSKIKR